MGGSMCATSKNKLYLPYFTENIIKLKYICFAKPLALLVFGMEQLFYKAIRK